MAVKPLDTKEGNENEKLVKEADTYTCQIVWWKLFVNVGNQIGNVVGIYLAATSAMWQTNAFAVILFILTMWGVFAGCHRLWSHRSYKARLPLKIFLAFNATLSFQRSIFYWARNHRLHHKYVDTDADPHNSRRGFFFCHIGWLFVTKHPEVFAKSKTLDLSDLLADPVVRFQDRFYWRISIPICFILPTVMAMTLWEETFMNAFFVAAILRLGASLHASFFVNSAAHMWGSRPYNVRIKPTENVWVSAISLGEGFHNFHHTFPCDYSASEFGIRFNLSTAFINLMAWLGLAYDLKTVSQESIQYRKSKTGEESRQLAQD